MQDGRIVSVGRDGGTSIPAGAVVVDVSGRTILPGFVNAHVHEAYDATRLRAWAHAGVTTVRDLGTPSRWTDRSARVFVERDALNEDPANARLVAAGPIVTAIGGYGAYGIRSPEDAREKIGGLIDSGADLIKIALEDNLQGRTWAMLSPEETAAIVETAHAAGLRVSAHVSRAAHIERALDAGVDDVAHGAVDAVPSELIGRMIEERTIWVPTLELWACVARLHDVDPWLEAAKANLTRFVNAGGRVALGTDYAGYVCTFDLDMPMTEIRLMSEAGMTPMQIIEAGTRNAAIACGLGADLGTLEPGKIADLIVVDGNPLEDLEALRNVQLVVHNGELIRDDR